MSYSRTHHKRTVHCSYCHDSGHNKSSCPARALVIEQRRERCGDDDYTVRVYDAKKAKRRASALGRKCSYCSRQGHNRASCSELRTNIFASQIKNVTYRHAMLERMKALGVGVGAVLSTDRYSQRTDVDDYDSPTFRIPQVIVQINWDLINFFNTDYSYFDNTSPWLSKSLMKIDQAYNSEPGWIWDSGILNLIMGEGQAARWLDESHSQFARRMNYFCDVESPVPPSDAPPKWLLGGDLKFWKRVYKGRESYQGAL